MTPDPYSLDRLHDIVVPPPVPEWPPAAGFWFLLALVLVWAVAITLLVWLRYRRNAYRRQGAARLREITPRLRAADSRTAALAELAELLKCTALAAFPRDEVAALSGADWLAFLDRTGGAGVFTSGPASVIATGPYRSRDVEQLSPNEKNAILTAARRWIRCHQSAGSS